MPAACCADCPVSERRWLASCSTRPGGLVGTPSTKLSDHVGHTVEVTGTIADKAEKATGSAAPADLAAAAQMSLNVGDLRMIAATCADK